jgi:hypothetical protein
VDAQSRAEPFVVRRQFRSWGGGGTRLEGASQPARFRKRRAARALEEGRLHLDVHRGFGATGNWQLAFAWPSSQTTDVHDELDALAAVM